MGMKIENQLAVVTGASSGIGFELATQFALHGFDLLITAEDIGIEAAKRKLAQHGTKVDCLQVDLSRPHGVESLYSKIKSKNHVVDAIAINAGVGVGGASFDKKSLDDELNLIRLNVMSVVHLTKLILPQMLDAHRGRILFTSSVTAFMPGPYETVYAASKAFVQSFSDGLRAEVKDKGIVVTALQPGPTETNFFHRAGMDDTRVGSSSPKEDPIEVARQGFEALMEGRDSVITTPRKNKMQTTIAKMHGSLTKPKSHDDR